MRPGECLALNIATGKETSVLEIAGIFQQVMPSLEFEFAPGESTGSCRKLGSTELAARRLGFNAQVMAEEGLRSLLTAGLTRGRSMA